mgnify:CR=1 FL=1
MNLYLIRHSVAENISINKKDFERELTEDGKQIINKASRAWKTFIHNFDIVLSSPLTRAVQTAEIISKNIQPVPEVIKENNLGIGSRTSDLIDLLNGMDFKNIAVVGHQPDLSHHIINFCGTGNFNLVFPPAALAKIEFENSIKSAKGKLVYLIPPIVQL